MTVYLAQKKKPCRKIGALNCIYMELEFKSDCSPQNFEACEQKSVQKLSGALDPVGRVSGAVTRCYGNEQNTKKRDNRTR